MKENKQAYIFMGNSGSGKGTQAHLLESYLKDHGREVFYTETGSGFRDFLTRTGYGTELAQHNASLGALQPEFLAISMWSQQFLQYLTPRKDLITDGFPRTRREAKILDGALKFYQYEKPNVIYLPIPREVAHERMISRGRGDDAEEKIARRLEWFERDVLKAIDFYSHDDYYNYIEIDGTQSIEAIHQQILEQTSLT